MKRRLKKMKKTISGVLLALTAVFTLAGCKKSSSTTISFYCWNEEFKTRLNELYPEVKKAEGSKTTLKNGVVINWVQSPNQSAVYQNSLDVALDNDLVDMFCFEADYATKYVKSNFVADMGELGIKQDNQYKYTKDIVTNASGKIVGSSWQATPGIICYNTTVAKAVFGDSVSHADMETNLNTWDKFVESAAAAKTAGKKMLIGTDDWFRVYQNNLTAKMFDGKNIAIDKQLFQWVKDTRDFADEEYIFSTSADYGLWKDAWGAKQGDDDCLCVFSCPWFTDFCLTGNVQPENKESGNYTDLGYKAVAGYKSWFWGGTWLTATKKGVEDSKKKDTIKDIIAKMTTDTDLLKKLAIKYGDFTNDKPAMEALAASDEGNSKLFGGQNVVAIYAKSVLAADLSKASDYDQQICENIQSSFRAYFQDGTDHKDAATCLAAFQKALTEVIPELSREKDPGTFTTPGVTISGETITIA